MSEENIFSDDKSPETVAPNPEVTKPDLPPEVAELVGEGKKYRTAEDALRALPHAQAHIQKIEEDNAKLKEEVAKSRMMEDLLKEFKQQNNGQELTPPVYKADPTETVDINSAVEAALARKEALQISQANAAEVISAFKTAFGDEGEAKFVELAKENQISIQELNKLAMTSPNAVLKLAGLKKSATTNVPHSTSTVRTNATNLDNQGLSAKTPMVGSSTKDVLNAWRNAGLKVKQQS